MATQDGSKWTVEKVNDKTDIVIEVRFSSSPPPRPPNSPPVPASPVVSVWGARSMCCFAFADLAATSLFQPKEVKESLAMYNCEGTVVTIKGKVTNVSMSNCKKCAIVLDSVVAAIEITRSPGAQLQVNESAAVIQVDNTEGVTIYLQSESARKADVVTSSSTQVNIVIPQGDNDPVELNVPEQFKSSVSADGKTLTTVPTSHI
jgi:Adenylate cyclase associated (CAP) C terminal